MSKNDAIGNKLLLQSGSLVRIFLHASIFAHHSKCSWILMKIMIQKYNCCY